MKRCRTFIGVQLRRWQDWVEGREFNFYVRKYYILFLNVGRKIAKKIVLVFFDVNVTVLV